MGGFVFPLGGSLSLHLVVHSSARNDLCHVLFSEVKTKAGCSFFFSGMGTLELKKTNTYWKVKGKGERELSFGLGVGGGPLTCFYFFH